MGSLAAGIYVFGVFKLQPTPNLGGSHPLPPQRPGDLYLAGCGDGGWALGGHSWGQGSYGTQGWTERTHRERQHHLMEVLIP